MSDHAQYCTFTLSGLHFGVPVQEVQEVIRSQELTKVPLASGVVGGLINLRGQIVTAIDLRRRLALPERDVEQKPMNVVVRTDDGVLSLLADEIGEVIEVSGTSFEPPPETLREPARALVRGTHKLPDRLLLLLNTAEAAKVPSEDLEPTVS
jgi:purine-binding chemotaxis protein CheW